MNKTNRKNAAALNSLLLPYTADGEYGDARFSVFLLLIFLCASRQTFLILFSLVFSINSTIFRLILTLAPRECLNQLFYGVEYMKDEA